MALRFSLHPLAGDGERALEATVVKTTQTVGVARKRVQRFDAPAARTDPQTSLQQFRVALAFGEWLDAAAAQFVPQALTRYASLSGNRGQCLLRLVDQLAQLAAGHSAHTRNLEIAPLDLPPFAEQTHGFASHIQHPANLAERVSPGVVNDDFPRVSKFGPAHLLDVGLSETGFALDISDHGLRQAQQCRDLAVGLGPRVRLDGSEDSGVTGLHAVL